MSLLKILGFRHVINSADHTQKADQSIPLSIKYHGKGSGFASQLIKNLFFTVCTFGIYYPWAKTNLRKYIWQNIEIIDTRLEYTGTGREIFIGYLKVLFLYGSVLLGLNYIKPMISIGLNEIVTKVFSALFGLIVPVIIFNAYRYLAARTRYRGIYFGLVSGKKEFVGESLLGFVLSILSFGLYYPIMRNNQRKIIFNHLQYGNLFFKYEAPNKEIFLMCIKGTLLSVLTLGIYYYKFSADLKNYIYNHLSLDGVKFHLKLTWNDMVSITILYLVFGVLTFGLGLPWYKMLVLERVLEKMTIEGNLDFTKVEQIQQNAGAGSNSLADMIDIDLDVA